MQLGTIHINLLKAGYNNAGKNERTVEVPLGLYFKTKYPDLVELGAVLPYYQDCTHEIIDLYDAYPNSIRTDLESVDQYSLKGRNVLSISTIEHIGFDNEKPDEGTTRPIKVIEKVIAEAAHYLLTLPIGFNRALDEAIKKLPGLIVISRDAENQWARTDRSDFKYNSPYDAANALWLITNIEDLR